MSEPTATATEDWRPADRDELKELIGDALDSLIGFEWDPADLDDAAEAVTRALEAAGFVPTLGPAGDPS